jgi:hypothetical protein
MIRVEKSPEPLSLVAARKTMEGYLEKAVNDGVPIVVLKGKEKKAAKNSTSVTTLEIALDDELYKPPEAKARLILDHHGKCAYCETRFMDTAGGDVEHFRPKGGYQEYDPSVRDLGKRELQGYFWLAYRWENHLWSCKECNETFKASYFGLMPDLTPFETASYDRQDPNFIAKLNNWLDQSVRRLKWGDAAGTVELPVLLNPGDANDVDPRLHINYDPWTGHAIGGQLDDTGQMMSNSHRGSATIAYLGLNRPSLVFTRSRHLLMLRGVFVEMTRDLTLVVQFLEWQRGPDWSDEAHKSRHVQRQVTTPDRATLPRAMGEKLDKERAQTIAASKAKLRKFDYPDMVMDVIDEPVALHEKPEQSASIFFSKKFDVLIEKNVEIRDDPQLALLDFLKYSVSPPAHLSGLAMDALAVWSLELAEHIIQQQTFAIQLNKPNTTASSPNRAHVDVRPPWLHHWLIKHYLQDQAVRRTYEAKYALENSLFNGGTDRKSVCFVCRVRLHEVLSEHAMLQTMASNSRHVLDYGQRWWKNLCDLEDVESSLTLYGCTRSEWEGACKQMLLNLEEYCPDPMRDLEVKLNGLIADYTNMLSANYVNYWWNLDKRLPEFEHQHALIIQEVTAKGTEQQKDAIGDSEASATLIALRENIDAYPPGYFLLDEFNQCVADYTFMSINLNQRAAPDYATAWQALLNKINVVLLKGQFERLDQNNAKVMQWLTIMKAQIGAHPPDPTFQPSYFPTLAPNTPPAIFTPQIKPFYIETVPVGRPAQIAQIKISQPEALWVVPKAAIVKKPDYTGAGQQSVVWDNIRASKVNPQAQ